MLATFLSQVVNGLILGSLIGLIALGYTMVYGIIQLINFAHGEVFMVGAYGGLAMFTYLLPTFIQQQWYLALPLLLIGGAAVSTGVAVLMERFAYRPLRGAPRLAPLITALGVSVVLQELVRNFYPGATAALPFPKVFVTGTWEIPVPGGTVPLRWTGLLIIVLSLVLAAVLTTFVNNTRMGRAMRAVSQDPDTARLMGVDTDRIIVLTFALGAALAGVAGIMYGTDLGFINIDMGFQNGIFAFTAAVLGGIGNLKGAVVGGIVIGLVKALGGPVPAGRHRVRLRLDLRRAHRGAGLPAAGILRRVGEGARMTTTTSPAGAPAAPRPPGPPPGRVARLTAALGPHATAVRAAGGLLTLVGALLPWATFVLNSGPYPDKATLQYFVAPFGVTGFRLQLLLFGIAALVLTFAPVPARGRILRGLAWGIIGIAVVNGLYITVEGGGLGAITVADGSVAFGAVVTLLAGVLVELGARAGGVEPRPVWTWRFGPWVERVVLVVVYVLLLLVVAATLTSGGTGGAANPYSGAVFLSFLAALGGAFAALHASGLMTWVATVAERHQVFSVVVAAGRRAGAAADRGRHRVLDDGRGEHRRLRRHRDRAQHRRRSGRPARPRLRRVPRHRRVHRGEPLRRGGGEVRRPRAVRPRHGDLRGGRGDVRRHRRLADAAGARRLPRDRHPRLRRDLRAQRAEQHLRPDRWLERHPRASRRSSCSVSRFSDRITIGGLQLPAGVLYYVLIVFLVALVMLVFSHLKESRLGRAWIAIREDEDAARAMGIRTGPIKIMAFLMRRHARRVRRGVLRAQDRARCPTRASGSRSR